MNAAPLRPSIGRFDRSDLLLDLSAPAALGAAIVENQLTLDRSTVGSDHVRSSAAG